MDGAPKSDEEFQITITRTHKDYFSAHKALYAVEDAEKAGEIDFAALRRGERPKILSRPWSVEIYPTMACQIDCIHCYAQDRNREYRFKSMPVEMMDRLHVSLHRMGVRGVQYCGGGEPLIWKRGKIAEYIGGLNLDTTRAGMASNMLMGHTLADPETLRRMIFIEVAVFAHDDESYFQVAARRNCPEKVAANVKLLQEVKRDNGLESPAINAKILINQINYRWLHEIYDWSVSVGFDNIHLRLVDDYEDGVEVALTPPQIEEFKHSLLHLCDRYGLDYWRDNIGFILGAKGSSGEHSRCWTVRLGLNAWVLSNGEVYVCGPQWGTPEYCIGNLNFMEFDEIWGGAKHQEVAAKIEDRMMSSGCYKIGCRHIKQTKAINAALEGQVAFPPADEFEPRHSWFL
ncbi:MAG: SPASM domain-containing protein [Rhodobacter sp.]|nr:SPASM domain-containing protein [Rhodobacter sp.]